MPVPETEFRFVEKVHVGTLAPKMIKDYTPLIWVLTARDGDRIHIAFEYIMIRKGESLQVSIPQPKVCILSLAVAMRPSHKDKWLWKHSRWCFCQFNKRCLCGTDVSSCLISDQGMLQTISHYRYSLYLVFDYYRTRIPDLQVNFINSSVVFQIFDGVDGDRTL